MTRIEADRFIFINYDTMKSYGVIKKKNNNYSVVAMLDGELTEISYFKTDDINLYMLQHFEAVEYKEFTVLSMVTKLEEVLGGI